MIGNEKRILDKEKFREVYLSHILPKISMANQWTPVDKKMSQN